MLRGWDDKRVAMLPRLDRLSKSFAAKLVQPELCICMVSSDGAP